MNLDRFSQGPKDPQSVRAVTFCAGCGLEIYPGEYVYDLGEGVVVHSDYDCLTTYLGVTPMLVEDVPNVFKREE